jgi:thioredoxin reductase (NADPH)
VALRHYYTMSKSIVGEDAPSQSMGRPILLIVHHEASVLRALEADLLRRFGGDYRILARAPAEAALQTLADLSSRAEEVALVIAPEQLAGAGGVEFMKATHGLYPAARRVLLIGRGGYSSDHPAINAMILGQIDYYVFDPWFPLERWLFLPITELLADWTASRKPSLEAIRVVGEEWDPRSHALREVMSRVGIPHGSYSPASEVGRRLLEEAGQDGSKLPVVVFHTGTTLVDPSHADLAEALGFSTTVSGNTASCRRRLRGFGGAAHSCRRVAGTRGTGRYQLTHSELSRISGRHQR